MKNTASRIEPTSVRWLSLCGIALALFASASPVRAEGESLLVMTYNIRYDNPGDGPDVWTNRREALARYVAEVHSDVIGLQEAEPQQIEYLAAAWKDYRWYGVGREDGKTKGEGTPIFYRPERLEALDRGTFWLSEEPDRAGSKSWDSSLPRICSWIKFRDRARSRELFVFCTHFDHRGAQARRESARLLRAKIAALAGDLPVVLLGDFNCRPDSPPYVALTATTENAPPALLDAQKVAAESSGPTGTINGFKRIAEGTRIDYVFVRGYDVPRYRVDDPRVNERFVSDHLPVVAELRPSKR